MPNRSIKDIIRELENYAQFENKGELLNWFYEYACQTAEWEGIDYKIAHGYIKYTMRTKLESFERAIIQECQKNLSLNYIIDTPRIEIIPDIVRREHGGVPVKSKSS